MLDGYDIRSIPNFTELKSNVVTFDLDPIKFLHKYLIFTTELFLLLFQPVGLIQRQRTEFVTNFSLQ